MEIQEVFEVPKNQTSQGRDKDVEMMARSFYRLLRKNGYTQNQVINVAGYMLDGLIREFETEAVKVKQKKGPGTSNVPGPSGGLL